MSEQQTGILRNTMTGSLLLAKNLGFEPKTVIDVGAALGTFNLYETFPNARHLLIEPIAENEPYLAKICRKLKSAEYIIAAASKESGVCTLSVSPGMVHSAISEGINYLQTYRKNLIAYIERNYSDLLEAQPEVTQTEFTEEYVII